MNSLKKIFFVLAIIGVTTSCDLDINVDPNNPVTVPNAQLLSASQVAIFSSFGVGAQGLGQVASVWVHQTMQRISADGYGSTGADANIVNPWTNLYAGALTDLELIIKQGSETEQRAYLGIAKILKAYSYSMMVDVWGDIPYSEANLGLANAFPKFDDDEEIYNSLFALIDEGIADLTAQVPPGTVNPAGDDLIYAGDLNKWRRFAKALKLRMYNTIRKHKTVNSEIQALMNESPNDILAFVDPAINNDFELNYFNVASPANRNPGWLAVSGATTYFSKWLYEIMSDRNTGGTPTAPPSNPIYDNLPDPRLFYYLYNSLGSSNASPQNPPEVRDGNYLTINFSSQSVNQGFDQSRGLSMPGLYYAGGKFDNAGVGGSILVSSAPGNAPQRLLCKYEVSYILAELMLDGVIPGNASATLGAAIDQSFAKVESVRARVASTAPSIASSAINTYRNGVLARFNAAATNHEKLEHILTQKWIANFGNPLSSYTDFRRTGLPKMFDPNTDADPNTQLGRAYPFSYPYRQLDTRQGNPNAPEQKLIGDPSARVFWDVD